MTTIITIDEVKEHLNIICSDDDTLISLKIQAAEDLVQAYTGRTWSEWNDDTTSAYSVPPALLEAVRQIAGNLYEDRTGAPMSKGTVEMLAPFRLWAF